MAKRMHLPGVRPIGSFVPKLTRKPLQKYGFPAASLVTDWAAIVGADLASYTLPERLKWPRVADSDATPSSRTSGATLHLRVEGARALDVQYRSRQIIERINAHFGYRAVGELRLLQAPLPGQPRPRPEAAVGVSASLAQPVRVVAGIPHQGLRSALERLQASLAREASGR
ncbi:MAG TPA: DciA family protein [Hyphomicrobiaceae bacterium]|nr:DciA family protein [Hyphomicrobiaceae bacterium]